METDTLEPCDVYKKTAFKRRPSQKCGAIKGRIALEAGMIEARNAMTESRMSEVGSLVKSGVTEVAGIGKDRIFEMRIVRENVAGKICWSVESMSAEVGFSLGQPIGLVCTTSPRKKRLSPRIPSRTALAPKAQCFLLVQMLSLLTTAVRVTFKLRRGGREVLNRELGVG